MLVSSKLNRRNSLPDSAAFAASQFVQPHTAAASLSPLSKALKDQALKQGRECRIHVLDPVLGPPIIKTCVF